MMLSTVFYASLQGVSSFQIPVKAKRTAAETEKKIYTTTIERQVGGRDALKGVKTPSDVLLLSLVLRIYPATAYGDPGLNRSERVGWRRYRYKPSHRARFVRSGTGRANYSLRVIYVKIDFDPEVEVSCTAARRAYTYTPWGKILLKPLSYSRFFFFLIKMYNKIII